MSHQSTFGSYTAVAATDTDAASSPREHPTTPRSVDSPYGIDAVEPIETSERYTTFGYVEYRPPK
ncbi:hypothetical protein [Halobaculum rarum]|uniref:hypothetical protein n=1 Tax=Halobaculum rarum TaxID=3075122 RepID=UPI0032AFD5BA